jgi:hypothetical protein
MTMHDLKAGYTYVVGTHFCFPPIYARFGVPPRGRKATWHWTHELLSAYGFVTQEDAERQLAEDPKLVKLLEGLDVTVRRRITVLKAELKVKAVDHPGQRAPHQ